jgi:hypothetical protein
MLRWLCRYARCSNRMARSLLSIAVQNLLASLRAANLYKISANLCKMCAGVYIVYIGVHLVWPRCTRFAQPKSFAFSAATPSVYIADLFSHSVSHFTHPAADQEGGAGIYACGSGSRIGRR